MIKSKSIGVWTSLAKDNANDIYQCLRSGWGSNNGNASSKSEPDQPPRTDAKPSFIKKLAFSARHYIYIMKSSAASLPLHESEQFNAVVWVAVGEFAATA
jgi:hypothetical protein